LRKGIENLDYQLSLLAHVSRVILSTDAEKRLKLTTWGESNTVVCVYSAG